MVRKRIPAKRKSSRASSADPLAKHRARSHAYYDSDEWRERCEKEAPDQYGFTATFKRITDHNVFIADSQSGHTSVGTNDETGVPYEILERSYMVAFVPVGDARKLVEAVNIETDYVAWHVEVAKGLKHNGRVVVTKQRVGLSTPWSGHTRLDMTYPPAEFELLLKDRFGPGAAPDDFELVTIVDSAYGRMGIMYGDVLAILDSM